MNRRECIILIELFDIVIIIRIDATGRGHDRSEGMMQMVGTMIGQL